MGILGFCGCCERFQWVVCGVALLIVSIIIEAQVELVVTAEATCTALEIHVHLAYSVKRASVIVVQHTDLIFVLLTTENIHFLTPHDRTRVLDIWKYVEVRIKSDTAYR